MRYLIFLLFLPSLAFADVWYQVVTAADVPIDLVRFESGYAYTADPGKNEYADPSVLPTNVPYTQWVRTDTAWRAMTPVEIVASEMVRQSKKAPEFKLAENMFFNLVKAVLVAAEDPRATDPTAPKMTTYELSTILDAMYDTNAPLAIRLSTKLLAIDAELKRFDIRWWDDAAYHPEML